MPVREATQLSNTSSIQPPSVSSPPEADSRPYRKFNVGAAGRSRVYMRCWVCGAPAEFGRPDEWAGLEELTGWAAGHVCPATLAVTTTQGCDRLWPER